MFNWFKKPLSKEEYVRRMYRDMDKERQKRGEVWHYECENGHIWESYESPTGSLCKLEFGMKETSCPQCESLICKGNIYINGKKTKMGAIHINF